MKFTEDESKTKFTVEFTTEEMEDFLPPSVLIQISKLRQIPKVSSQLLALHVLALALEKT